MIVLLKKLSILFLFFTIPFLGISQVLVSYNKAPEVDFKKYKTYQVYGLNVTTIPEFEPKKESINFLIKEIDKQMVDRGHQKVKENPELILNIGIVIGRLEQSRLHRPTGRIVDMDDPAMRVAAFAG